MKSLINIWSILGVLCLLAAVLYGAWWHLFTSLICFLMSGSVMSTKKEER